MSARTFRMDGNLPSLYIPWPQCSHCGQDAEIDDGYAWCEGCLIQWRSISEDAKAEPDPNREGTEVPCEIVVGSQDAPHERDGKRYIPGPPLPCILPSGHEGAHLCPYDVEVIEP